MKKTKSNILVSGLILMAVFTGCTTTRVANLTKLENETIDVFTTKIPDREYVEISYIQTDGSIFHTSQQLLNGLKKRATELKADAVINVKYDFQAWYPVVSGTAIKYSDK